jgi:ABC-type taurine transport system substrate-binding protein
MSQGSTMKFDKHILPTKELFRIMIILAATRIICSLSQQSAPCIPVRTSSFAEANPFEAVVAANAINRNGQPHYCFQHTHAPSGMRAVDKLDNDELDIAALGSTPAANAIARGCDITVLSVMHGLSGSESLAVRSHRISNPQDLRGKSVGVPCGSTSHYALLAFLKQTGVANDAKVVCGSPNELLKLWKNKNNISDPNYIDGIFVSLYCVQTFFILLHLLMNFSAINHNRFGVHQRLNYTKVVLFVLQMRG